MTTATDRRHARQEALLRVAATHRPLAEIFADLRGGRPVESVSPADRVEHVDAPPIVVDDSHDAEQSPELTLEDTLRQTLVEIINSASQAREAGEAMQADAEDIALRFAVDAESMLVELSVAGAARLAEERGLAATPATADAGVDAAGPCLVELAEAIADATEQTSRSGVVTGFDRIDEELISRAAARLSVVAVNAGYAAAARAEGLSPRQHFGDPYCPAPACYGQDTRLLDASTVMTVGLPPYADDCNCTVLVD